MNRSRSVVLAVVVSTFFVGFGGGVVFPVLPNLGAVLGISPFIVGVILSANRFTRILANAPAGSLIDRIGTRGPLIGGLCRNPADRRCGAGRWAVRRNRER